MEHIAVSAAAPSTQLCSSLHCWGGRGFVISLENKHTMRIKAVVLMPPSQALHKLFGLFWVAIIISCRKSLLWICWVLCGEWQSLLNGHSPCLPEAYDSNGQCEDVFLMVSNCTSTKHLLHQWEPEWRKLVRSLLSGLESVSALLRNWIYAVKLGARVFKH